MLKILLVCNAGMSTGILAKKMEAERPGEVEVHAVASSDYAEKASEYNVLLVGPQIRYMAQDIEKEVDIPVMVIDFRKYGMLDANGILQDMDTLLEG